jgi:hypothetical protein
MVLDWVQGEFQDKRERKMADLARFKTMVTVSPAPQPHAAPSPPPTHPYLSLSLSLTLSLSLSVSFLAVNPLSSPFLHSAPPDHARAGEHAGW